MMYQSSSVSSTDGVSIGKSGVRQNDSFPVRFMAATKNMNEKYETLRDVIPQKTSI